MERQVLGWFQPCDPNAVEGRFFEAENMPVVIAEEKVEEGSFFFVFCLHFISLLALLLSSLLPSISRATGRSREAPRHASGHVLHRPCL